MRFKKPKPLMRKPAKGNSTPIRARVIAGVPSFWETARDHMPEFFLVAGKLPALTNRILEKPVRGQLAILLYFHVAVVAESFGAMVILCLNGYCQDAVVIARSMFEYAVNARYLQQATPAELEDYIDFHWVKKKKYFDCLTRSSPQEAQRIPASAVQEMMTEFAKVEHKFLRKNKKSLRDSWSEKSLRERADSVGMGELYPTFYPMASGLAHGDISGLGAHLRRNTLKIASAPSVLGMRTALVTGHNALLTTLGVLNNVAKRGFTEELNEAEDDFVRIWGKPQ